ncbi:MAG: replicative DNA helicase [Saprospiraceae bacterium]|nr:replicative DNA helicase [Saprospiraceae bacterium]
MEKNTNKNNNKLSHRIGTSNRRQKSKDDISNMMFGKIQPQATNLEQAVLGALMLDKDAVAIVIDILRPESFYVEAHKEIYKSICKLFEKNDPIDLLTVTEKLKQMGMLEAIGGPYYLVELTNRVASAANIEYHARIISQKFIQRELIRISTETIRDAYEDTTDVFDLLDKAEQNLFSVTQQNLSRGYLGMDTLVNMAIKQLEEMSQKEEGLTGVPTGFVALDRLTSGWQPSDLIIVAARPGMGKCLGKGTKVLMYDGQLKKVEDVLSGDLLMGDDSTPRKVLSIARGREKMYWIHQNKGISYRVNESHILSLKRSRNEGGHKKGEVLNISVKDWLSKSDKFKSNYKGYKVPVEFAEQETLLPSYFLGLWLGDGSSSKSNIYTQDKEVVSYLEEFTTNQELILRKYAPEGKCPEYTLVGDSRGHRGYSLMQDLRQLNLIDNKHIPQEYLINSTEKRLELLAGLLDSNGHYLVQSNGYEITQKNKALAEQIKFLCDSLGFRTSLKAKKASISSIDFESTVYRIHICGDVNRIPVKINYKAAKPWKSIVDWQVTDITVEEDIVDDYYGFTLDQNNLFLLEDMTVTHNTSFTMAVARNAAIDFNKGVAFFSLEMSSVQLVNRLISMETEIASEKLRQGRLEEYQWQQLYAQTERLSNVPIYIDDTPGISVFELRAKCRRLKMQYDIQLIVIDYLQLMTVGSDSSKGNREQEISTISRSLKGLAKELSVPVIALSQLSRAVETRGGSKRPQLSDLRECVTGDTRVQLSDGRLIRIDQLLHQQPKVWSIDNQKQKIQSDYSDLVWKVGKKPVYKICLASGRYIQATGEHRLLGADGWVTVDKLEVGQRLSIARFVPEPEKTVYVDENKLIVLAHLIGDGSYLKGQPLRYTTATESHSEVVRSAAQKAFGVTVNRHESKKGTWHQLVFSGNGNRWRPAGINAWFREIGIFDQRSVEKQIPDCVFQLNNEQLALFLRHLWATDGTIFTPKTENTSSRINFATNSRILAEDVAQLLLRFSIVARIRTVNQGEHYKPMYSVEISGTPQQLEFLDKIGAFGAKEEQAIRLYKYLKNKKSNTNADTIPTQIFDLVKDKMKEQGISQRKIASLRGTAYGGSSHFKYAPSRGVLTQYADILDDDELYTWASSDLYWDKIIEIEPIGEEEVYDLTVLSNHNWIANGIISHNSGAIEQDADIVSFIYRPEYYQILEDEEGNSLKGIGEIIIAKHRNGSLDTVRLKWDGQFARFSNLEDDAFRNNSGDDFFEQADDFGQGQTFSSKMNSNEDNRGSNLPFDNDGPIPF